MMLDDDDDDDDDLSNYNSDEMADGSLEDNTINTVLSFIFSVILLIIILFGII